MNPSLPDPNNHVPEVSPKDDWGDSEGFDPDPPAGTATVLPPRRTLADRPPTGAATAPKAGHAGLRIEPNLARGESSETPVRLEVQEISGGGVVRLEQMVPAPLKVPRQVTFQERPVQTQTHGESASWGFGNRHPTLWILGAGVAVVAIVISTMMLLPAINAPDARRDALGRPATRVITEEKIGGMEAMNLLLTKQPEAMQIFRSYATAIHPDEFVPLIRDGIALEETLRRHWRPRTLPKQWAPDAESTWAVLEVDGQPCALLLGNFPDLTKFAAYFTHHGDQLLLDWKATAAFGTATFGQLEQGAGDPGEIRGEISSAEFYSVNWPEAEYQSYRLISPDGETALWCYARRGDPANHRIAPLFRSGEIIAEFQRSQKVTLRLEKGAAESLPNQWLIGEVLHLDWITR